MVDLRNRYVYAAIGIVSICLLASFIVAEGLPFRSLQSSKQPEKLESGLRELVDNYNSVNEAVDIAKKQGIYYEDGKVRVIIELEREDSSIPKGYGIEVEVRHGSLVQALVPIEKLHELARAPEVKYIRSPREALTE